MTIRPGRNLVRTAAVLLVLATLTFVWPGAPWLPVSGFTLVVAVVVAALDYRALQTSFRGVKIERTMPAAGGRDLPFRVELRVCSSGPLPLAGELRDVVPAAASPHFRSTRSACRRGAVYRSPPRFGFRSAGRSNSDRHG